MSEILDEHPHRLPLAVTAAAFGTFVYGCVIKQPAIAISGLAIGGIGSLRSATVLADSADIRHDQRALVEETMSMLEDNYPTY